MYSSAIDAQITKITSECEINPGRRSESIMFLCSFFAVRDREKELCSGRVKELIAVQNEENEDFATKLKN
ncbi:CLUMA_CG021107, isoform A [Clunio marinus]|uniref:CLUMA_CG021107, isoform A n=1 Tax=Clunio marinus TaxID=568069 RepID=A0A1J1J6C5_9DIPT|nr:CLUMA_CG021107, isoform A [Clunio marinus]